MFKILILQRYYNLSDEQIEFQIKDRLSQLLFDTFTQKLISHGIVAKEGSIVDASFVTVPKQRNKREENKKIHFGILMNGHMKYALNIGKLPLELLSQEELDYILSGDKKH